MTVTTTTPPQKDVYNPLLFEIAWEVANKGMFSYTK